jgi:hypothetical protein
LGIEVVVVIAMLDVVAMLVVVATVVKVAGEAELFLEDVQPVAPTAIRAKARIVPTSIFDCSWVAARIRTSLTTATPVLRRLLLSARCFIPNTNMLPPHPNTVLSSKLPIPATATCCYK